MKAIIPALLIVVLLPWNVAAAQNPPESSMTSDPGKAIFTNRCGTCHDADASKKLPDGTTLLGRLAKKKRSRDASGNTTEKRTGTASGFSLFATAD